MKQNYNRKNIFYHLCDFIVNEIIYCLLLSFVNLVQNLGPVDILGMLLHLFFSFATNKNFLFCFTIFLHSIYVNMGQIVNGFIFFARNEKHFIFYFRNNFMFFTENQNHFIFSKKAKSPPILSNGRPLTNTM